MIKTLDKMKPYRWFYIILFIMIAMYFAYGREILFKNIKPFEIFVAPLMVELGYIFVRRKKFKDEFSIRRYWGVFLLYYGLKGLFN
jgi:hypothetical protein